jgi:CheY-like chemotaxis protein
MSVTSLGGRTPKILIVDDDMADVELTREGFEATGWKVELHHVVNGRQCMEYLRKQGKYAESPTPDLILLDLNMPLMDGREVLTEIVKDERLRTLPVVIFTTSKGTADVVKMYGLRCNSYIVKPVEFEQLRRTLECLCNYWFATVVLPSEMCLQ